MKYEQTSNISATNKMDYICTAINRAGFKVHLVSPSWYTNCQNGINFKKQTTLQINKQKRITFCPSFSTSTKWWLRIKITFILIWLFFWLVIHAHKNEKILVYHVQWLSMSIRWAKKIKGFKLILEVEEIYGDVSAIHPYFYVLENTLLASADNYVFSTELLVGKIKPSKPYIIIYGEYKIYPKLGTPSNDGKIH